MILMTGAFGNAGRYIIPTLLEKGLDVVAVDIETSETRKIAKQLTRLANSYNRVLVVCWGDLTKSGTAEQPDPITQAFIKHQLTGVVHIAFIIPPWSEIKAEYAYQVNVGGTRKIMALTTQYAPLVPFVFASSTTVFGPCAENETYINESHPTQATSNYTRHKLECEELLKASQLNWRILRFSAIMNPTMDPDVESRRFGMKISLATHIEPVHVDDVAIAVYHALIRPEAAHKIFIISGGKSAQMLYRDFIMVLFRGLLGELGEKDIPWEKFDQKPYFLHWYDTTESQAILGYQQRSIEDFVRDVNLRLPWWKKWLMKLAGKKRIIEFSFPDPHK